MNKEDKNHEWTGEACLVAHFKDGKSIPQCKKCKYCGMVEYPYDSECKGSK